MKYLIFLFSFFFIFQACDDSSDSSVNNDANIDANNDTNDDVTDVNDTGDSDGDTADSTDTDNPFKCEALPQPDGTVITVTPSQTSELKSIVQNAQSGTTIMLEPGVYDLSGGDTNFRIVFWNPGITLRSSTGNPDDVILDGNYGIDELISVYASDTVIADITLMRAYNHPVHISGQEGAPVKNILIHNIKLIDPGQQGIKVNRGGTDGYVDESIIECSVIELTDEGRTHIRDNCYTGGIDVHKGKGLIVRNNFIKGFWCENGLAEHGIHFWRESRDTLVENNIILDCARGIGFGLGETADDVRTYPDNPFPDVTGYIGHYFGIIRNNFIAAASSDLFASEYGFDSGIGLEQSRETYVYNNTVASETAPFSSIEWRWDNTKVYIYNNLVTHNLRDRGGESELNANIENADSSWFTNIATGDLHLTSSSSEPVNPTVFQSVDLSVDIDGEPRDDNPDIGADEFSSK